tara:strand:+ start:933 stop:1145 length:213 start_codon:yes stop_codon:yes gene_type:complete
VEHQSFPATGTPQVATVIDGESKVLYAIRLAMQYSVGLDVRTLVFVAVPVGAVLYAGLYVLALLIVRQYL